MVVGRPKVLRTPGIDLASQKGICSLRFGEKRPHARRERSGRTANGRARAYSPIDSIDNSISATVEDTELSLGPFDAA